MRTPLIICVGNVARGDDGVGHEVARRLAAARADLEIVTAHALDVALAEPIARSGDAIIVDAVRTDAPLVSVDDVSAESAVPGDHGSTPGALLALAHALYGVTPRVRLVSVAAPEMPHGVGLSQVATEAAEAACGRILSLLG